MAIEDKPWLDMSDGEEELWWNHPHIIKYTFDILVAIGMIVGGIALTILPVDFGVNLKWYPVLISLAGVALLFGELIRRSRTYYVITNQKIVIRSGIISEDLDPVHFNRIANTKSTRTAGEMIMSLLPGVDIADIRIETAGTDSAEMNLLDVPDARKVTQLIEDMMNQNKGGGPPMTNFDGQGRPPEREQYPDEGDRRGQSRQDNRRRDGQNNRGSDDFTEY